MKKTSRRHAKLRRVGLAAKAAVMESGLVAEGQSCRTIVEEVTIHDPDGSTHKEYRVRVVCD